MEHVSIKSHFTKERLEVIWEGQRRFHFSSHFAEDDLISTSFPFSSGIYLRKSFNSLKSRSKAFLKGKDCLVMKKASHLTLSAKSL